MKIDARKYFLILTVLSQLALAACDSHLGPETEKAWQESSKEALVEGYTNFKACYLDSDAAVYIFQYDPPGNLSSKKMFSILAKQCAQYKIVAKRKNELVLRKSGIISGEMVFDEYRFFLNKKGRLTVMFASIDSKNERENYKYYLHKFYIVSFFDGVQSTTEAGVF